jgi:hypothetical protein
LTARETVAIDTPARRATSRMLMAPGRRFVALFLGALTVKGLYAYPVFLSRECAGAGRINIVETVFCSEYLALKILNPLTQASR